MEMSYFVYIFYVHVSNYFELGGGDFIIPIVYLSIGLCPSPPTCYWLETGTLAPRPGHFPPPGSSSAEYGPPPRPRDRKLIKTHATRGGFCLFSHFKLEQTLPYPSTQELNLDAPCKPSQIPRLPPEINRSDTGIPDTEEDERKFGERWEGESNKKNRKYLQFLTGNIYLQKVIFKCGKIWCKVH